jgi:hypothetical protein
MLSGGHPPRRATEVGLLELRCVEQAELVLLSLIVQNHEQLTGAIELHLVVSDPAVAS